MFVIVIFTFSVGGVLSGDNWQVALILDALIAVAIVLAAAFLAYGHAAALVLRLANARPITKEDEPELYRTAWPARARRCMSGRIWPRSN